MDTSKLQLEEANNLEVLRDLSTSKINLNAIGNDPFNFKAFDADDYRIMYHFEESSEKIPHYNVDNRCYLKDDFQNLQKDFIPGLAEDLGISEELALEKVSSFFEGKTVLVQPTGLQGKVYKITQGLQNWLPINYSFEAVSVLKSTSYTGINIITSRPLVFVGTTYLGAIFFGYCGSVAGNGTAGFLLNGTSYLLTRPMRMVEITLNGLILEPISILTGLPLILNGTQEILRGKGLPLDTYARIGKSYQALQKKASQTKFAAKVIKIFHIIRE